MAKKNLKSDSGAKRLSVVAAQKKASVGMKFNLGPIVSVNAAADRLLNGKTSVPKATYDSVYDR